VLGRLHDDAQALQGLEHLDADRPDGQLGAVGQRL